MRWQTLLPVGIIAVAILTLLVVAALAGLAPAGVADPRPAVAVQPLPTAVLPPTPSPGAPCPVFAAPLPPSGVTARDFFIPGEADVTWIANRGYQCGQPPQDMACGFPPGDFVGWDLRWSTDTGERGLVEYRPEADPCAYHHYILRIDPPRYAAIQVRAVARGANSGWSAAAYYPPDAAHISPTAPTPTPGPSPTPGGPTPTPFDPARARSVWAVAYDPNRGLPAARVPSLPDAIMLRAYPPETGAYLDFANLPHCAGYRQWRVVWPDDWAAPGRYQLRSPSGGYAPVTERSWNRELTGVIIQGHDYSVWRMTRAWDCARVAGQTLRVYR